MAFGPNGRRKARRGNASRQVNEQLEIRLLPHDGRSVPNLTNAADLNAYADQETSERRETFSPPTQVTPNVAPGMPQLNSRPGAPTAIFLDFDGDTPTAVAAYDEDGDPTTFNATEAANITECWRQMSI